MKLHIDKRKKLTKPFFPWKRSNFFYKHFCIEKWRKKVLIKKREFSWTKGLPNSQDNIEGYLRWKKLRNRQCGSSDMELYVIQACPGNGRGRPSMGPKRKKDFDRPKMVQFAKLIGLNRNLSTFRKYPLQGVHSSQCQFSTSVEVRPGVVSLIPARSGSQKRL